MTERFFAARLAVRFFAPPFFAPAFFAPAFFAAVFLVAAFFFMALIRLVLPETNPIDRDGKRHSVKVAVGRQGASVRSRNQLVLPRGSDPPMGPRAAAVLGYRPTIRLEDMGFELGHEREPF